MQVRRHAGALRREARLLAGDVRHPLARLPHDAQQPRQAHARGRRHPGHLPNDAHQFRQRRFGAAQQVVLATASPFDGGDVCARHLVHVAKAHPARRHARLLPRADQADHAHPVHGVVRPHDCRWVEDHRVQAARDDLAHLLFGQELAALVVQRRDPAQLLGALVNDPRLQPLDRDAGVMHEAFCAARKRRIDHVARAVDVDPGLARVVA